MFEQTFKNIDDILHKDAGCSSELDYVEQTSWVLFLKYLDDLEKDRRTKAELAGKKYEELISPEYKWEVWAAPKKDGKLDHHKALTGDDLADFVNIKLFPYLKKFKTDATSADTIEYKIGEIFSELKNRIQSGYNLREVINYIDELRFRTHAEKHEMSHLYESKIQNMGNAGRNGGEYYTPRPLIKTIVKVVDPEIGNKIYDGAVGSAGFLVEAFEYLKAKYKTRSTSQDKQLQTETFFGKEKKSLAYIIGIMNMILHGIEAPNIIHTNTLTENLADVQEKDRYDVVLANPPFGGKERAEVQQNFPIKTGETAYLFLEHFIKMLRAGGKCGVVIKNTFLSNTDNASIALRKKLLEDCNLHTVLDLPGGTFTGAGVKTVVLFFEKGTATRKVWYYQLNLERNLGKTNSLNENDLAEFIELQKTKANSENSWTIKVADVDTTTFDLSPKNPNKKEEAALRQPKQILEEIKFLDEEGTDILNTILELL
jgi:type I restriction enzyme M protein